ncbi:MAG: hypothetical protein J4432_02025 [DPANN group archaeon]|nr:hypothetical protein [DPANN group archaeon]
MWATIINYEKYCHTYGGESEGGPRPPDFLAIDGTTEGDILVFEPHESTVVRQFLDGDDGRVRENFYRHMTKIRDTPRGSRTAYEMGSFLRREARKCGALM